MVWDLRASRGTQVCHEASGSCESLSHSSAVTGPPRALICVLSEDAHGVKVHAEGMKLDAHDCLKIGIDFAMS